MAVRHRLRSLRASTSRCSGRGTETSSPSIRFVALGPGSDWLMFVQGQEATRLGKKF